MNILDFEWSKGYHILFYNDKCLFLLYILYLQCIIGNTSKSLSISTIDQQVEKYISCPLSTLFKTVFDQIKSTIFTAKKPLKVMKTTNFQH